jgi:hypothetical protein
VRLRNKTDRSDAREIAQMMRLGQCCAVHIKNIEKKKVRTLLSKRNFRSASLSTFKTTFVALEAFGLPIKAVA